MVFIYRSDTSFITQDTGKRERTPPTSSPLNSSMLSWHSSFNDGNYWLDSIASHLRFVLNTLLVSNMERRVVSLIRFSRICSGNRSTNNALWSPNRSPTAQQHQQSFGTTPTHLWNRTQNAQQMAANTSPNKSNNNSFNSPYKTYSKDEVITDEHGLQKYLR